MVRWVAESKRPFSIVNDCGFRKLMKTGRPDYHIPSAETLSRDVKKVFAHVRKRIAKMLQVGLVPLDPELQHVKELTYLRNMKAHLALEPMLGPLLIIKPMSLSPFILNTKENPFRCF